MRIRAREIRDDEQGNKLYRNIFSAGQLGIVEKTGADDLQTQADRSAQVSREIGKVKTLFIIYARTVSWPPCTPSTQSSRWWERRGSWT